MTDGGKWGRQTQHVFFHCRKTTEDPAHFCKLVSQSYTVRVPHDVVVPSEDAKAWRAELQLRMWELPAPYARTDEATFWEDIGVFLAASHASIQSCSTSLQHVYAKSVKDTSDVSRFPAILVTDSEKLCRCLIDSTLLTILADVSRLPVTHLLPVILFASFKELCGGWSVDTALESWTPFASEKTSADSASNCSTVDIGLGVYVQKHSGLESIDSRFGARAFLLFGDGTCSYFAVSPDGARGVRACGQWDVINGLLVLGCAANDIRPVQMDLNNATPQALDGEVYDEPLYLALEDIPAKFDGPMSFDETLSRFSRDVRAQLLEAHFAQKFQDLCEQQELNDASQISKTDKHKPGPRPTGLLRPGKYAYTEDPELTIKIVLHGAGSYSYTEESLSGFITPRVPSRLTLWRVADGQLVLSKSRDFDGFAFVHQKARNSRTVEQQIRCVKIPVSVLLDRFKFTPFEQETDPFPGHMPVPKHKCIGGFVDPLSAALQDPEIENDRMPLKDFERALELCGILGKAGASCLNSLKPDEDGNMGVKELQVLDSNCVNVASLEHMEAFRQGLIASHGCLHDAFRTLAGSVQNKLTPSDFDEQVRQHCGGEDGKRDEGKLKEWVDETDTDEMRSVFNSLDINNDGFVDCAEFQSLQYGAIVLKLRLVDQFVQFIRNHFRKGSSDACFRRAFECLNIKKEKGSSKEVLDKDEFIHGVTARLGYPHQDVARFVFSLIDRNFNYKITAKEFGSLHTFSSTRFLDGLERFKNLVDSKFGGLDRCFEMLLIEEAERWGKSKASSVQCSTFEIFCRKKAIKPPIDLRTMFIFLDDATGGRASGYISESEWAILKGFDSRFTRRQSAKMPHLIKSKFGTYQQCFQELYKIWIPQELSERLNRLALTQGIISCGFSPEGCTAQSPQVAVKQLPARKRVRNPAEAIGIMEPQRSAIADWNGQPRSTANLPIRQHKLPGILPNLQEGTTLSSGRGRPKMVSAIEWGWRSKLDPGQR